MAEQQPANARRLTRGKAIFIAVLGVILVLVLYIQFGRGGSPGDATGSLADSAPTHPKPPPVTATNAASNSDKRVPAAATIIVDETKWKSPNLADVVDYDPFALPENFPQPKIAESTFAGDENLVASAAAEDARRLAEAVERLTIELNELKQSGVQVIVRQRDEYVAMIGDRTLHVGDEIKGFTVTKIDPAGVVVERKATE